MAFLEAAAAEEKSKPIDHRLLEAIKETEERVKITRKEIAKRNRDAEAKQQIKEMERQLDPTGETLYKKQLSHFMAVYKLTKEHKEKTFADIKRRRAENKVPENYEPVHNETRQQLEEVDFPIESEEELFEQINRLLNHKRRHPGEVSENASTLKSTFQTAYAQIHELETGFRELSDRPKKMTTLFGVLQRQFALEVELSNETNKLNKDVFAISYDEILSANTFTERNKQLLENKKMEVLIYNCITASFRLLLANVNQLLSTGL
jgi:hypothetical protein